MNSVWIVMRAFLIYIEKEDIEVEINGETQKCMAYVMNGREISLPTAGYYNTIVKGYRENGIE